MTDLDWRTLPAPAKAMLRDRLAARVATARASNRPWLTDRRPDQVPPPGQWWVWLLVQGRGAGKALDVSTPIPTPTGWTTMGDLRRGDVVLGADGHPTRVVTAHPVQHGRPCYRVVFSDGASLVADADHQWSARSRADRRAGRPYRTVTTADMLTAGLRCAGERQWQMPAAAPLQLDPVALLVDPYVLGFWLGDGTSAAAEVTIGDGDAPVVLGLLAARGVPVSGPARRKPDARCATYPIGGRPLARDLGTGRMIANGSLHSDLRTLAVLGAKHIPAVYLRASLEQRTALLAGLIDSDGYVEHTTGRVEIDLMNERLAAGVAELARTLGHRARLIASDAVLGGRVVGPRYRVVWVARGGGGYLPRKQLPDRTRLGQPDRLTTRYVTSIDPVLSRPVRCISVSATDRLYLAGDRFLVTHNTRTGAETTADLARDHPGARIALVAPTFGEVRDTMVEGEAGLLSVLDPIELRGGSVEDAWNRSTGELYLANGTQMKAFSSERPGRLRGPVHNFCWIDELAQLQDANVDAGEKDTTWSNLTLGLRLKAREGWPAGYSPRIVATTTPRPVALLRVAPEVAEREPARAGLTQRPGVVITRGRTDDNLDNLSDTFRREVVDPLRGTRTGRQELDAELLSDIPGALVTEAEINRNRVLVGDLPRMVAVVTGVDPATTDKRSSAETGIVTVAVDTTDAVYVLADASDRYSPETWGRAVWAQALEHGSQAVVVEDNAGGDMVEHVLVTTWQSLQKETAARARRMPPRPPIVRVTPSGAAQSKWARAQPVGLLYEVGRVHHVTDPDSPYTLSRLEDQLQTFTGSPNETSPDRVDALVHAVTWMMFPGRRSDRPAKDRKAPPRPASARWSVGAGRR